MRLDQTTGTRKRYAGNTSGPNVKASAVMEPARAAAWMLALNLKFNKKIAAVTVRQSAEKAIMSPMCIITNATTESI